MIDLVGPDVSVGVELPIGNSTPVPAARLAGGGGHHDGGVVEALSAHLGAVGRAELAEARAWAVEHPLWTLDDVAASRRWWRSPGAAAPVCGETWVVAGDEGWVLVGRWRRVLRCDDELAWSVIGEVGPVSSLAMARVWLGIADEQRAALTHCGLQAAWREHLAGQQPPSWLCDLSTADSGLQAPSR